MKTTRLALVAAIAALSFACAGSPTAPSPSPAAPNSPLAGLWRGDLVIATAGAAAQSGAFTGATTWRFVDVPGAIGYSYTTTIESTNPAFPGASPVNTGYAGSEFSTEGSYKSSTGCLSSFQASGHADAPSSPSRLSVTFRSVDCGHPLTGTLTLVR